MTLHRSLHLPFDFFHNFYPEREIILIVFIQHGGEEVRREVPYQMEDILLNLPAIASLRLLLEWPGLVFGFP